MTWNPGSLRPLLGCALSGLLCGLLLRHAPAQAQAQQPKQQKACLTAHVEGQRLRLAGQFVAARDTLLACAQSECPRLISSECTTWLADVEDALSSVVFAVSDQRGRDLIAVRIWSDGALLSERADGRARLVDPGVHAFRFEAAGYQPAVIRVPIRQSERNRILRIQLAPGSQASLAPASSTSDTASVPLRIGGAARDRDDAGPAWHSTIPLASYVLGGIGLAGIGTFAYFALDGASRYHAAEQSCAPACRPSEVAAGKRAYVIANVGLGVGVASTASALIVYLVERNSRRATGATATSARLVPELSARAASLHWIATY